MKKLIFMLSTILAVGNMNEAFCGWGQDAISAVKDGASWVGHMAGNMAHEWRDNANSGNTQWHKDVANAASNAVDWTTSHAGTAWDQAQAEH